MTLNQGLPTPAYPLVDNMGKISPVWFQFMQAIWQRTGGGSQAGNVQSVTVESGSGILSSVANPTSNVTINLTLGGISPVSVSSLGPVSGTTGYFPQGLTTLGQMQFGAYVNTTISNTGFISIVDASGVTRKLMVGA